MNNFFSGTTTVKFVSASGAVTISLAGKDQGAFSAGVIMSDGAVNRMTQARVAGSGSLTMKLFLHRDITVNSRHWNRKRQYSLCLA